MKNLMGMMKQAQELQAKMQELQAELESAEVEGTSGGGMVRVALNGKGEMKNVRIDESLLNGNEKEVLEDLIVAAHHDAKAKAEAIMQEKMQSITGGLPLPPGLKLF